MKKITILLVALLMLTGCAPATKEVKIRILVEPELEMVLLDYVTEYQEKYNIEIEFVKCDVNVSACDIDSQLSYLYKVDNTPDIVQFNSKKDYEVWSHRLASLNGQNWLKNTEFELEVEEKIVGLPVSYKGYGVLYNSDLLLEAGVMPTSLNDIDGYKAAFKKINTKKKDLGINSVVSIALGLGNVDNVVVSTIGALLGNGISYSDNHFIDSIKEGYVSTNRFDEFASWINLLFTYSNKEDLLNGGRNDQYDAWLNGESVFTIGYLEDEPAFNYGVAPMGAYLKSDDGILVDVESYLSIFADSENLAASNKFINDLFVGETGVDYLSNQDTFKIPFRNIGEKNNPIDLWINDAKYFNNHTYEFEEDYLSQNICDLYIKLANKEISTSKFSSTLKSRLTKYYESEN